MSEMVDILDDHHDYVPCSSSTIEIDVTGDLEIVQFDSFHQIVYFGDQLTVERMRGAQGARCNSEHGIQQLKGFVPAVTDWHAKVSFLDVSPLYSIRMLNTCTVNFL